MSSLESIILFFGLPTALLVFLVVSLVLYIKRDKDNEAQCAARKTRLIISSVIFGAVTAARIVLLIIIALSLRHM